MDYSLAKKLKDKGFPQHGRDVMTPHFATRYVTSNGNDGIQIRRHTKEGYLFQDTSISINPNILTP